MPVISGRSGHIVKAPGFVLTLLKLAIMLDTIESAIGDIKAGKLIIVVDDEDRENEGDFITAARNATPELINFMSKYGRGLICTPLIEDRCEELQLDLMVNNNTALHETAFTVSVDLLGHGCTTGISAHDRAKTIQALIDPHTKPADLGRPGHIFPLRAKKGGVLRRAGHTEATIDLARLAGFDPAGILVEIMNEDGSMARLPELKEIAKKFDLKLISIKDLIEYRLKTDSLIEEIVRVDMPTKHGHFKLVAFNEKGTSNEHLALIKGEWTKDEPVLTRVHSSCFTGDILGSLRCDCGDQLEAANLHLGFPMDKRDYGIGAQILRYLGVTKLRLMSNNPKKRAGLLGYGIEIIEAVPVEVEANPHNEKYLTTKRDKLGHEIMKGSL
jgi:3,4-dihydroxy 2-butanone 4-phosphate synthase / GTP cyclohydrolase II